MMRRNNFLVALIAAMVVIAMMGMMVESAAHHRHYHGYSLTTARSLQDSLVKEVTSTTDKIRVCSFNIQVLGVKKMQKQNVAQALTKILSQYDIVLVQEVRDSSDQAFHILAKLLNDAAGKHYSYVLSERLGRTNSKEQYGVMYNSDLIKFVKSVQYKDTNNWFERPPFTFAYELITSDAALKNVQFAIMGCHIKPGDAVNELNHMKDAYEELKNEKFYPNTIMMGDFNAGCGYVSTKQLGLLALRDAKYTWLITDNMDTTVAASDCPYDRFIVQKTMADKKLANGSPFEINSVGVYKFDKIFSLTTAQAAEISDHFPIELTIQTKAKVGGKRVTTLSDLVAADFDNLLRNN